MTALLLITKYWRQLAAALLLLAALAVTLYLRSVFHERDQLLQEKALLTEQLKSAAAMQELTDRIAEEVGNIKERSQANVSRMESEPKPVFVDTRPLPFIPGGMLQAVYSSPAAAARVPPRAAPGGPLPPGEPAGRVLSR